MGGQQIIQETLFLNAMGAEGRYGILFGRCQNAVWTLWAPMTLWGRCGDAVDTVDTLWMTRIIEETLFLNAMGARGRCGTNIYSRGFTFSFLLSLCT